MKANSLRPIVSWLVMIAVLVSAVPLGVTFAKDTPSESPSGHMDSPGGGPPPDVPRLKSSPSSPWGASTSATAKTFRTDSAPELDWYQPCQGGDHLIDFYIDVHDIDVSAIKLATLTLAVWDVDFDCGAPGECERDAVYLNGHRLTTPEPWLTGANDQWSTCTFNIEPQWIVEGDNYVEVDIDTLTRWRWCVECDWAELAVEMEQIDLRVESKDISIAPKGWWEFWKKPYDISATVHNDGIEKAENVQVKIVRKSSGVELNSETKTIGEIAAGTSATVSVSWNFNFRDDIEVVADAADKIDEVREDNNKAQTTKISGTVGNSAGQPLVHLPVKYQEKVGSNWVDVDRAIAFTETDGSYSIPNNLSSIVDGREGRVSASLIYSPAHDEENSVFRVIDEAVWGSGVSPSATTPISKHSASWTMDKASSHTADVLLADNEGGVAYVTLVTCYGYHKSGNRVPAAETLVEINDADGGAYMSGDTIHFPPGLRGTSRPSAIGHEFAHVVEQGWRVFGTQRTPSNPQGHDPTHCVEEGSAHWGSCVARGSAIYKYPEGSGYVDIDISDNSETSIGAPPSAYYAQREFQIAGTMWDLNHDYVWSTLEEGGGFFWPWEKPDTPENFYKYYKDRDPRPSTTIKGIFQAHNYNTTGWPGKDGQDPDVFTEAFSDYKIDVNGDGHAEYLRLICGLDIPSDGTYTLTASIEGLDFGASNGVHLTTGVHDVPVDFYGESIFESEQSGPYSVSVYLYDEEFTLLDYRLDIYLTAAYDFTEFQQLAILFTGNHVDYGVDTDSDGLFNYLATEIEVSISESADYEISGSLYYGDDFIAGATSITHLDEGVRSIALNFEGVTIHASNLDGPYTLYISVPRGDAIDTSAYTYSEFQNPGASLEEVLSDFGLDADGDGLYDNLVVELNVNVTLPDTYMVAGHLYDGSGGHMASAYSSAHLELGSRSAEVGTQLNFDGIAIRDEGASGPYALAVELFDNKGNFIGRTRGNTSYYESTQFQVAPEDQFDMTFADYGTDDDANGLYDWLTLEVGISSPIKVGDHRLDAYLRGGNGSPVAFASAATYVDKLSRTLEIQFSGEDIWRTGVIGGEFALDLEVFDGNSTLIAGLDDIYTTSAYDFSEFESPPARFFDAYSDYGVDTDTDGLYDYLAIDVTVQATAAGDYTVSGWLSGSHIAWASRTLHMDAGNKTFSLDFDGIAIYEHGTDGPYVLGELELHDANGTLLDYRATACTTSAYSHTEFQRPPVRLSGDYADYGRDVDSNGLYDFLTVDVGLVIQSAGNYAMNARLMDQSEREIVWAATTSWVPGGQPTTMQLDFDGRYINRHGANGPYYLRDVYVYNIADASQADYVYEAHVTGVYSYADFETILQTDLPNVHLICADQTVDGINVSSLDVSQVDQTYKPQGLTPRSAYLIDATGSGSFTLQFTDVPDASDLVVYKIDPASTPLNQWVELEYITTADTVTLTMDAGDPPVVFASATTGTTLNGEIDLQGRVACPSAAWVTPLTVALFQPGTSTLVGSPYAVTTDDMGKFVVAALASGTYDIGVKSPRSLSRLASGVVLSGPSVEVGFGTLLEGDANNDDNAGAVDYSVLYINYGKSIPEALEKSDFNRDGYVGGADYSLLYINYGKGGEMPRWPVP